MVMWARQRIICACVESTNIPVTTTQTPLPQPHINIALE